MYTLTVYVRKAFRAADKRKAKEVYTFDHLREALQEARDEVEWESTQRVTVIDSKGESHFDEMGFFSD